MSTPFWFTTTLNLGTNQGVADWAISDPTPEETKSTKEFLFSVERISKEIFQGGILSITGRFSQDLQKRFSEYKPEDPQRFFQFLNENGLEGRYFYSWELSQSLGDIFVRTEAIYQAIKASSEEEERSLGFLLHQEHRNIHRVLLRLKTDGMMERLRTARDLYESGILNLERIPEVKEARQLGWEATIIWERSQRNYERCSFLAPPFPFERESYPADLSMKQEYSDFFIEGDELQ